MEMYYDDVLTSAAPINYDTGQYRGVIRIVLDPEQRNPLVTHSVLGKYGTEYDSLRTLYRKIRRVMRYGT